MGDVKVTFKTEADTAGTEAAKTAASDFGKELGQTALKAIGVGAALDTLKKGIEGIITATNEAQLANVRLSSVLQGMGESSASVTTGLKAQADAISEQIGLTGTQVTNLQATAAAYGVLPQNIDRVVRSSLDVNAAMGGQYGTEQIMRAVMNAVEGHVGGLQRMGIHIDAGRAKTEGLNYVLDALAKFQGAAGAQADTAVGSWKKFNAALDDLKVSIGHLFEGKSGPLNQMTEWIQYWVKELPLAAAETVGFAQKVAAIGNAINEMTHGNFDLVEGLNDQISAINEVTAAKEADIVASRIVAEASRKMAEENQKHKESLDELAAAAKESRNVLMAGFAEMHGAVENDIKEQKDIAAEKLALIMDQIRVARMAGDEEKMIELAKVADTKEAWDEVLAVNKEKAQAAEDQLHDQQERELHAAEAHAKKLEQIAKDHAKKAAEIEHNLTMAVIREAETMIKDGINILTDAKKTQAEKWKAIDDMLINIVENTAIKFINALISEAIQSYATGTAVTFLSIAEKSLMFETGGVVGFGALPKAQTGAIIGGGGGGGGGEVPILAHSGEIIMNAEAVQELATRLNKGAAGFGGGPTLNMNVQAMDANSFAGFLGRQGSRGFRALAVGGQGTMGMAIRKLLAIR